VKEVGNPTDHQNSSLCNEEEHRLCKRKTKEGCISWDWHFMLCKCCMMHKRLMLVETEWESGIRNNCTDQAAGYGGKKSFDKKSPGFADINSCALHVWNVPRYWTICSFSSFFIKYSTSDQLHMMSFSYRMQTPDAMWRDLYYRCVVIVLYRIYLTFFPPHPWFFSF